MSREEYLEILKKRVLNCLTFTDASEIDKKYTKETLYDEKIQEKYYRYLRIKQKCSEIMEYINNKPEFLNSLATTVEYDSYFRLSKLQNDDPIAGLVRISESDELRLDAYQTLSNNNIRKICIEEYSVALGLTSKIKKQNR